MTGSQVEKKGLAFSGEKGTGSTEYGYLEVLVYRAKGRRRISNVDDKIKEFGCPKSSSSHELT